MNLVNPIHGDSKRSLIWSCPITPSPFSNGGGGGHVSLFWVEFVPGGVVHSPGPDTILWSFHSVCLYFYIFFQLVDTDWLMVVSSGALAVARGIDTRAQLPSWFNESKWRRNILILLGRDWRFRFKFSSTRVALLTSITFVWVLINNCVR